MKNEMVNELIGVMRERIPKGSNLANSPDGDPMYG